MEDMNKERALIIGVDTGEEADFERSMEELKSLAEACNMVVIGKMTQKMQAVNKALYVGTGKMTEIKEFVEQYETDIIIFDNPLTPSQIRNLQHELDMPILDRTALILEIFASRAQTREAKLQVETARLQYLLPRLVGMHEALSRQGGASGSMSNKGTGEKKLELDRRKIEHRISELRKELDDVQVDRQIQRKKRMNSRIPQVALVGYTNAGKSTIMNQMIDKYIGKEQKKVLEKNMLFATLETSVRTIETGDNKPFFLVDTVGFIHKLPHGLVKAFHSTLEEVRFADLLIQIVDYSDPQYRIQMEVTAETLKELGAADIPMIIVYNKAEEKMVKLPKLRGEQIYLSAVNGVGIDELVELIKEKVYAENKDIILLIPYEKGNIMSYFMENSTVFSQEYLENGVRLVVNCHKEDVERYRDYIVR